VGWTKLKSASPGRYQDEFERQSIRNFSEKFIAVSWRRQTEVRQCAAANPGEQPEGGEARERHAGAMGSAQRFLILGSEREASDDSHTPSQSGRIGQPQRSHTARPMLRRYRPRLGRCILARPSSMQWASSQARQSWPVGPCILGRRSWIRWASSPACQFLMHRTATRLR